MEKIILVTGATGKQGGALIKHLLGKNFTLRALTRNPKQPAAQDLAKKGVEIVKGDMNDIDTLYPAMKSVYGVFSTQDFWGKKQGKLENEVQQGKNLAQVAKECNVQHFIQTMVAAPLNSPALLPAGIASKVEIAQYIMSLQLPWTFVGEVTFMEQFLVPLSLKNLFYSWISLSLTDKEKPIYLISVDDIGKCIAYFFENRDKFLYQKIDVVTQQIPSSQIIKMYCEFNKKFYKYRSVFQSIEFPKWLAKYFFCDAYALAKWINEDGFNFSCEATHQICPNYITLENIFKNHFSSLANK